jgi:hypothetical protein
MVAELSQLLLSDEPPAVVRRARIGDHFHYWRGRSGRRYLFTAVHPADIADFRSVVALVAEPVTGGRLAAKAVAVLDAAGRVLPGEMPWPRRFSADAVLLVHFLAETEAERRDILADLVGEPLRLAA